MIKNFKNAKQKLLKTKSAIWFSKICTKNCVIFVGTTEYNWLKVWSRFSRKAARYLIQPKMMIESTHMNVNCRCNQIQGETVLANRDKDMQMYIERDIEACSRDLCCRGKAIGIRVQAKCDGIRWGTGGEVKGNLPNEVGSQYSSHYLGTWCIQHYYR